MFLYGLVALLVCLLGPCKVKANTEKVIFLAPDLITLPKDGPSIEQLNLPALTPASASLRTRLEVVFANASHPHGLESWYTLHDLSPGQRHEVRICWAAIQPTSWQLDVFGLEETFRTPELIQSLALSAEDSQTQDGPSTRIQSKPIASPQSLLFLRIRGAADFFSLKKSLMRSPPAVHVDIILDPFLLNVFPRSLVPTAAYILGIAVIGWFATTRIWGWMMSSLATGKAHSD